MLVRLSKQFGIAAIATLIAAGSLWGQEAKQNWKDRGEYDLYVAIAKEANNTKKIELLDSWKAKYAATDFKLERLQLFLAAYQAAGQPAKMLDTAQEMLALNPKDVQATFWVCTLATAQPKPTEEHFAMTEKAANSLLASVPETFAADKKPQATSEADWKKARIDMEALAHKTAGWVAMQRKDNVKAEEAFRKSLQLSPAAGEVSYWLGTVIIAQKNADKSSDAIFEIARAATYDGPGSLNPEGRKQIDAYLQKLYNNFHGSPEGLEELRKMAKEQALPPEGFKIKSSGELSMEQEEELKKSNPQLALWLNIKKELKGAGGATYWEAMKGALLPGDAVPGVTKLKGRLVGQKPPKAPKELVLAMSDESTPEVTLVLDEPMKTTAPEGTEISFEGIANGHTADPFMVTFEVEKAKVLGWPAPPPPAKKRALPKKK